MDKFLRHTGIAVPLQLSDVDTDQILPARHLRRITRTGFGDALFEHWRQKSSFVLNQEPYRSGSILVAGPNFGTGSSREHAVWALKDYGFRVVICSRFADIFRTNAGKQGLLAAETTQANIEHLWEQLHAQPGATLTVDLQTQIISAPAANSIPFTIDSYTRWRLLEGYDDIDITEQYLSLIDQHENQRPGFLPHIEPPTAQPAT